MGKRDHRPRFHRGWWSEGSQDRIGGEDPGSCGPDEADGEEQRCVWSSSKMHEKSASPTRVILLIGFLFFCTGLWKGVLKDDFDFSTVDLAVALSKAKGGPLNLLLMGSAAELTGPKTKTVFLEDLPEEEVAKVKEP